MIRERIRAGIGALRRVAERWPRAGFVVAALVFCEVGARIALPGLSGTVLRDFLLQRGGNGLLTLFDQLVGGALSRGAVLALGVMPYLSARIMMRLARAAVPRIAELSTHDEGRTTLKRWTRRLTVGLSLVQSYGFARFTQTIPGAVADPGIGYIAQTMLVLTSGAIAVMWLSERITEHHDLDEPDRDDAQRVEVQALGDGDRGDVHIRPREPEVVVRR